MDPDRGMEGPFGDVKGLLDKWMGSPSPRAPSFENPVCAPNLSPKARSNDDLGFGTPQLLSHRRGIKDNINAVWFALDASCFIPVLISQLTIVMSIGIMLGNYSLLSTQLTVMSTHSLLLTIIDICVRGVGNVVTWKPS